MREFNKKIVKARQDIKKIYDHLDTLNSEVQYELDRQVERLKKSRLSDASAVLSHIESRMVELSRREKNVENNARIDELARVLDWVDGEE